MSNLVELMAKKTAFWLVRLARKIYPQSKEAMQFYSDCMMDYAIKGGTIVRVNDIARTEGDV
jgi:hypothetical protein